MFGFDVDETGQRWWLVAVRGVAAVVFGVMALVWPGVTLAVLVLLFGAYALVDGVLGIGAALRGTTEHRWTMGLAGVVSILAGVATFAWPGLTAVALLYIIAIWAIVTGGLEIAIALRLRRVVPDEWLMVASGALSVLFGILLLIKPGSGILTLVWLVGLYAILFGAALLGLAWRMHKLQAPSGGSHPAPQGAAGV